MTDHLHQLLPHHLAHLRASGLTDATIIAAGIYSETDKAKLARLLNWKRPGKTLAPAIVFPFTVANGTNGYTRVRPDVPRQHRGKPVKYESPIREPNHIYLPPGMAEHLQNTRQEIGITEGEKKSLALSQELLPTIGLVGCGGWKPKDHQRLIPDMEGVAWNGRLVYLVPDSDIATNENVEQAFAWAAKHLKDRGARVKFVKLPDGPEGAKVGVDDFIVAKGADAKRELRKLLDNAEEAPEVDPELVMKSAEHADPAKEAAAILASSKVDGKLRTRSYRGEVIYWTAGAYQPKPQSDVEAQVTTELNRHLYGVKRSHVGNIIAQMKAQSIIYSSVTPPAWIGEGERKFNAEEIIVCRNGVVSLPAFTAEPQADYLSPATPDFFTFNSLPYDFDPAAPEPELWLEFLDGLWKDDKQSIDTLQEWAGMLLVPWTSLQKILAIIGPRRAGKGVIARVLRAIIGEANVCSPTLGSLSSDYGLWSLVNKLAAFITDARLSGRTDSAIVTERLLNISGEDSCDIQRKYLEPLISVRLPTRIGMFSNELPGLNDSSGALSGRLIVLRLKESFYGRENPRLTDDLLTERAGILLWAIKGWARLRERGYFIQPESARELVDQMEELASPVALFVKECCELDAAASVNVGTLYKGWCWWCAKNGREPGTAQMFGRNLAAAASNIRRTQPTDESGGRYRAYEGIALRDEAWLAVNGGNSERDGTRSF